MTLKIERSAHRGVTIFALTGRLDVEHIPELERLFGARTDYGKVVVDLKELRFADREAVRFLSSCEMAGLKLKNCPAYVREWIRGERSE
jgi:hypothetical protein